MKGAENRENEPEAMGVESVDGESSPVGDLAEPSRHAP